MLGFWVVYEWFGWFVVLACVPIWVVVSLVFGCSVLGCFGVFLIWLVG